MNQDDPGVLELQWLEPEVGTPIRATLTDEDGGLTDGNTDFSWSVSIVAGPDADIDFHWNPATPANVEDDVAATAGVVATSYTPEGDNVADDGDDGVEVDEGRFLRVVALYTDDHQGASKKAVVESMLPVRAEVSTDGSPAENGSPDFVQEKDTRTVPEDTPVGAAVGGPFRAIEPDPEDTLTYALEAVRVGNAPATEEATADAAHFYIDNLDDSGEITGTGQIKVKMPLDFDDNRDDNGNPDGKYVVRVRATDPAEADDYIDVTITASNVNEPPAVTGQAELWVNEGIIDADDQFVYNALPLGTDHEENTYTATEPDEFDSIARWHLEGDDADLFLLSGQFEPRDLRWDPSDSPAPDYENPRDMNKDNVYEVTVVATDTDDNEGRFDVTVVVGNVDEPGEGSVHRGRSPCLRPETGSRSARPR